MFYTLFCTDRSTTPNVDAAPFQTYLTKEWKVFKVFKGEQIYRLPRPPVGRRNHLSKGILNDSVALPSVTRAYLRPY